MTAAARTFVKKSLDAPDEVRPFAEGTGKLELVDTGSGSVGRATFEPGWQWSRHIKPISGTGSCQVAHAAYFLSGTMTVRMDDGTENTYSTGDVMLCPPGHDAWVVGDEPCVVIDWEGFGEYAKAQS